MKYICFICLLLDGVLAVYYAIQLFCSREKRYIENRILAFLCLASAAWSFGFGGLVMQKGTEHAYFWWMLGLAGVFLYMTAAQLLAVVVSGVSIRFRQVLYWTAVPGAAAYLITANSAVSFRLGRMGMTAHLENRFSRHVDMIYLVSAAAVITGAAVYMLKKSEAGRLKAFAKKLLMVQILLMAGDILDGVFPMAEIFGVMGSSVTQCCGMVILYYAVNVINHTKINIMNMSEFIYYSLAMPVLVYDAERKLHIMNDAAVHFFGTSRELSALENIKISQLFAVDEQEVFQFEESHQDIDAVSQKSRIYCSLAVSKITDIYGDIIGYIIIVTDLSERIKAVHDLEEAKYEAEAANHAKSTFLAKMSHEIRTPMNAIIGFSELALKLELTQQVREYIEDIKTSSDNLLAIINDILDISKIESGRMELVCAEYYPVKIFRDVYLVIHTQAANKGLRFRMEIGSDIPRKLYGDKIRIRSILINLLNNAVKYTKQGSVVLKADLVKKQGEQAFLQFQVEDTGIGIREEEKDRLFQIFSQLDQRVNYGVEGTGLGLAIVKGYVTLMGGYITVDSIYGRGSVFTVVIEQKILDETPLNKNFYTLEEDDAQECGIGSIKIHGVHVLVVDDNFVNLKVAQSSLRYYGLEVDTASSGEEAVRLCREHDYHMVFMDQMMPQMDGIEAMRRIRSLNAHYAAGGSCKMIVLTADAVTGVRKRLIKLGFDEYLGKPMDYRQLERLFFKYLPEESIEAAASSEKHPAGVQPDRVESVGKQTAEVQTAETQPAELQTAEIQSCEKQAAGIQQILLCADVRQGICHCGGRVKDYLSVLQAVYERSGSQLEQLRHMLDEADYENFIIQVHALKGTALNIGAAYVSDLAKQLEQAGKAREYAYIRAHIDEFLKNYDELLAQTKAVLIQHELPAQEPEGKNGAGFSETKIIGMLQETGQCLEDFDYAKAAQVIRMLDAQSVPKPYQETAHRLNQWMDNMDIDKVQDEISRILEDHSKN